MFQTEAAIESQSLSFSQTFGMNQKTTIHFVMFSMNLGESPSGLSDSGVWFRNLKPNYIFRADF